MLSAFDTEKRFDSDVACARSTRDVVIAAGVDAASYLNGQVSQNVERLEVGASAWSFVLQPQGRISAWTRISRTASDVFWLDTDPGFGQHMLARLERFKLRTECSFQLFSPEVVSVRGPQSPTVEKARKELGERSGELVVAAIGWPGGTGFDVLGAGAAQPPPLLGFDEGDPAALEALRIRLGIPKMGAELGEKTIPAEAGMVNLSADFSKGCYVGQELVARIDSRGNNTPRRVLPVSVDGADVPAEGAVIRVGTDLAGHITSSSRSVHGVVALGSVKRAFEAPFDATVDDPGGKPVPVSVLPAHWL